MRSIGGARRISDINMATLVTEALNFIFNDTRKIAARDVEFVSPSVRSLVLKFITN